MLNSGMEIPLGLLNWGYFFVYIIYLFLNWGYFLYCKKEVFWV